MTIETKHTPTPYCDVEDGMAPLSIYGADNKGLWHKDRSEEEKEETRKFIVRACNSHDALVEALKTVVDAHEKGIIKVTTFSDTPISLAKEALKAVGVHHE